MAVALIAVAVPAVACSAGPPPSEQARRPWSLTVSPSDPVACIPASLVFHAPSGENGATVRFTATCVSCATRFARGSPTPAISIAGDAARTAQSNDDIQFIASVTFPVGGTWRIAAERAEFPGALPTVVVLAPPATTDCRI